MGKMCWPAPPSHFLAAAPVHELCRGLGTDQRRTTQNSGCRKATDIRFTVLPSRVLGGALQTTFALVAKHQPQLLTQIPGSSRSLALAHSPNDTPPLSREALDIRNENMIPPAAVAASQWLVGRLITCDPCPAELQRPQLLLHGEKHHAWWQREEPAVSVCYS